MINNMQVMAIIPARGGSKRLPNKNILPIHGAPLINWTIEAAKKSKYIDKVVVSTDNLEIANIAKQSSALVPELRPVELSTDKATTEDVVFYTIEKYSEGADIIVILQPTSPLRDYKHIDNALELLIERSGAAVVSVTECEHSPLWANTLPDNGNMAGFLKVSNNINSQDLDTYYRLNGAIYIYKLKELVDSGSMAYNDATYAYEMSQIDSVDIDNKLDFEWAEFLLARKSRN
ncbi:acylneuraminate cytidylyltransferase family protein [Pseudoalteromonas sp. PS5]|uniref:acylneuraminate cytidylyltransferase family protein n=1 Tax=Pseudoalteromonas sp. PS5 TaxID=1437473 RepID=UPI000FFEB11C|nr:acylneuraminate cytidylyltransferase family protein [Pseudoalteromonas sp. PS5]RXF01990.1 acylneuraminate cytidylyltransferase family protein [Pseudoalteromonas sp. PS5]